MMKWIALIVIIISGSILAYLYMELDKVRSGEISAPIAELENTIHIVHSYKDGIHRYAGQIKLPHSCYSVDAEAVIPLNDPSIINITLRTKDNLLSEKICSSIRTRYPFEVIADAPANAIVSLTLDGTVQPIKIVETNWQDSRGTQYNTLIEEMPK